MSRFSTDVLKVLERSGWSFGRRVSNELLATWLEGLRGFVAPEAARQVLREFGGLRIVQHGPGQECARAPFELDPLLAIGEDDRFGHIADTYGIRLFPLGEASGGHYFLALNEEGHTYLAMDDVRLVAESFDEALEVLIRGLRTRPVR